MEVKFKKIEPQVDQGPKLSIDELSKALRTASIDKEQKAYNLRLAEINASIEIRNAQEALMDATAVYEAATKSLIKAACTEEEA